MQEPNTSNAGNPPHPRSWRRKLAWGVGLSALVLFAGVEIYNRLTIGHFVWPAGPVPLSPNIAASTKYIRLAIEDRPHAPERPREGWCGEVSIQMACLFRGAFIPQSELNRIGKASHPDLYAYEIAPLLDAIGIEHFSFSTFKPHIVTCAVQSLWRPKGYQANNFIEWQRLNLLIGRRPIISGVVSSPGMAPPIWPLDHFVLTVGYEDHPASGDSLVYNPNWEEGSRTQAVATLTRPGIGFTFVNPLNYYFGEAVGEFKFGDKSVPVSLNVVKEDKDTASLKVTLSGLNPGHPYQLLRFETSRLTLPMTLAAMSKTPVHSFAAISNSLVLEPDSSPGYEVNTHHTTFFRCYEQVGEEKGRLP